MVQMLQAKETVTENSKIAIKSWENLEYENVFL